MDKPNCYECKYRRDTPGDAHSNCQHPNVGGNIAEQLRIVWNRMPIEPQTEPRVTGNAHGIARGWFFWPVNFDPVWLESCTGFAQKDK